MKRIKAHLWAKLRLGEALELILLDEDGVHVQMQGEVAAQPARGGGLSVELLQDKLLRLGNDPLEIAEFSAELEEGLHLPVSELNRARRELVTLWERNRLAYTRTGTFVPGQYGRLRHRQRTCRSPLPSLICLPQRLL